MKGVKIHPTAEVSANAKVGDGTYIWNHAQIREGAEIGKNCIIAKNVYIDYNVKIGSNVKIQNNSSIYHGAIIKDGVFIGPHVCITNDKIPRAITANGKLKKSGDWKVDGVVIEDGASIGAGSVLLPGISVGKYAMVGSGSAVTKNVPDFGLVFGNPARVKGYICKCGETINKSINGIITLKCAKCKTSIKINAK